MNTVCLVGSVVELPKLKETTGGIKTCNVLLSVERPFANVDGIYEYDEIQIEVWRGLAETICNTVSKGDYLTVRARVASRSVQRDGHTFYNYSFVAEKIGFMPKN